MKRLRFKTEKQLKRESKRVFAWLDANEPGWNTKGLKAKLEAIRRARIALGFYPKTYTVPNPCRPGGRKPVQLLTDRAKRYRAAAANQQAERRCIYCGRPGGPLMNEHINGKEADADPANLAFACRPCNTSKGALFARLGLGRRTAQFNPDARGAVNLAQWTMAVASIRKRDQATGRLRSGDSNKMRLMPVAEAVAMIRATPPDKRSEFARQIWSLRRQHGTDRTSAVPF